MKIGDIDPNFKVESRLDIPGLIWLNAKDEPFTIHGLMPPEHGKPFRRMPDDIAASVSPGVRHLATNTAGGRIRFRTDAGVIALKAVMPDVEIMAHITATGQAGFDLYRSDAGTYRYTGSFVPGRRDHGFEASLTTDGLLHTYTINMPLYAPVEEVYIGLPSGALVEPPEPYAVTKPVLYYGSSITQGGCASRPGNAYEAMISVRLDCDHINLGFSGGARAEKEMTAYLASLDPSVFVYDYDHNAPDPAFLARTHRPLYETFRAAHPTTPVIFVSRPDYYPERESDVKRREIILETYHAALDAGDERVLFADGAAFFAGSLIDSCTVDGTHPNDLGFFQMARVIGDAVEKALRMGGWIS